MAIDFIGCGKYVAKTLETNAEVAARLGIDAAEIVAKSGVEQRFIARDESASEMAENALRQAIESAGIEPVDLQAVIVATFSGDYVYPNTASGLCRALGIQDIAAFDVQANCAGFQMAVETARAMLLSDPDMQYIAVVGLAKQSPFLDANDVNTAYFFSDGASAVILGKVEGEGGILKTSHRTNGKNYEVVRLRAGGSSYPMTQDLLDKQPNTRFYEHAGLAVWKEVMLEMPRLIKKSLADVGWAAEDVDLVLMHQANLRLIEYILSRIGKTLDDTVVNIADIGNTADASLGMVISDAMKQNRLKPGMRVVLASVGAGFVYAVTPYLVPGGEKS